MNPARAALSMAGRAGQGPGGAGQVDGHGVNVNAGDGDPQAVEDFGRLPLGGSGGGDEVGHGFGEERAGAAGRVQNPLPEGVGYEFADDGAGQPGGGVVFAQLPPLLGRDDGLVEQDGDVGGGVPPVEAGDATGQGFDEGQSAHLGRPGKEVGFQNALQAGASVQFAALKQVGGVGLGQLADGDAEGRLHHHADDGGEVGVADEEVVHLGGVVGNFAEGGAQEVVPEAALDLHGFGPGVGAVELAQAVYVALVEGAGGAEVILDFALGGCQVVQGRECLVAQPVV